MGRDDFILNGAAHGGVAGRLLAMNGDVSAMRPWIGPDGRSYVTVNQDGGPVAVPLIANADTTLRKNEWQELDAAVLKVARNRLRLVADLRSRGLVYTVGNGMGKTVFQSEAQSDISSASISMDGLRSGENDRPEYGIVNLPLPIIHKDFSISARQLMTSRNGNSPLDTAMAEQATRKVVEQVESLTIGNLAAYTYGGGTIYGLINSPERIPVTIKDPSTYTGWVGRDALNDVLAMRLASQNQNYFGPWVLYNGLAWDEYMDDDFSTAKGDITLRQRLKMIEGIEDVRTLDNLSGFDLVLVQMSSEVIRMIIGMDVTTVQWETQGGMLLNFKVMCIMAPQVRADFAGNTGLVHGTV